MSRAATIVQALETALRTIHPDVGCTHDLTGAGRVVSFEPLLPGRVPMVGIASVESIRAEHGAALGDYRRTLSVVVWGVTTGNTKSARALAALALFDDVCKVLEADRSLDGEAVDLICHLDRVWEGLGELPNLGVMVASVEVHWHAHSGEGA